MERCNSLKRLRKETKPLSAIHILLNIVTHQRPSLYLLWQQFWRFSPFFVPVSPLFSSLFLSLDFPCFFYISQESSVFSTGTVLPFFFTNDCGGQTVALNEMAPAPNCIPTWGSRRGWRLQEHSNEDLWQMRRKHNKTPKGMALKSHSQCNIHWSCNRVCW